MMQGLNTLTPTPELISDPCHSSFEGNTVSSVIIIGGGASGVLLACHLLRDPAVNLRATFKEKRPDVSNPIDTTNPVPRSLIDQGLVRADPMQIVIDVAETCAIVGHSRKRSKRLFAVGPLTRAVLGRRRNPRYLCAVCAILSNR